MSDPIAIELQPEHLAYLQSFVNSVRKVNGQANLPPEAFGKYTNQDGTFRFFDMLHDPDIVQGGLSQSNQIKLTRYINQQAGYSLSVWDTPPYENPTAAQAVVDQAIMQHIAGELDYNFPTMPNGQKIVVVIDPGHGEMKGSTPVFEPGAALRMPDGTILTETMFIDPIAKALQEELAAKGIEVAFTRYPFEHPMDARAQIDAQGKSASEDGEFLDWRVVATNALIKEGYTPVFASIHADQAQGHG
ncbi:MAG: N-acetylmuramoyl-L-alanine amidase, partial [Alphaproteobacteria bacterium]|nr:N-acetylmuramoyl-L-alanine amidase [Alphaproteobacteria bacterium]